eukprot:CAMPEP_0176209392 /NCGR_PEP_ID=MMETSP0121_2-20121125/13609_1 /TAXON_ID=160619 /ORGANISM="Kryptoperidinium foliaceum, Strain CCMP 1326" /LENGTH=307 /DNA_ID=CAMNT_0017548401 /DNA_START=1 /DNA_END=924 /DNA_ORIENTATION=-
MPPQQMGMPMGAGAPLLGGYGAPPQQMMGPMHIDAYRMLDTLPLVHIVEKMNLMETAGGLLGDVLGVGLELEMANKYLVTGPAGQPLFFAVEQTDLLNRQCGGDCRAIDVDVVVLGQDPHLMNQATGGMDWTFNPMGAGVDLRNSQRFIHLHKDFQCTCCCFNRPVIEIRDGTSGQLIGRIKDNWACCDMTFNLEDNQGDQVFAAKGGCCQLGLFCPCPCGPCQEVHFSVREPRKGKDVARLKKTIPDCLKFLVADDVDNYEVDFGKVNSAEQKAMLIALGLFIDFRYFNTRSDKNQEGMDFFSDSD